MYVYIIYIFWNPLHSCSCFFHCFIMLKYLLFFIRFDRCTLPLFTWRGRPPDASLGRLMNGIAWQHAFIVIEVLRPVGFPASVLFSLHVYSVGYIQAALNTQFCQISLCACMLQGSRSIIENRYFALLTAFSHCSVDSLCCKCSIDTANKCYTFL